MCLRAFLYLANLDDCSEDCSGFRTTTELPPVIARTIGEEEKGVIRRKSPKRKMSNEIAETSQVLDLLKRVALSFVPAGQ